MAEIILPEGAPEEVVTNALVREIDLNAFGATGSLSLITLDNGQDHNRPNTFGPKSVMALNEAITIAEKSASVAIAITGQPRPVEVSKVVSDFAAGNSRRASTRTTSISGASTRMLASAAMMRT